MDRKGRANESVVTPLRGSASSRHNERTRARIRAIMGAVPGRWDAIVLDELMKGPRRPAELERAINAGRDGDKLNHSVLFGVLGKLCERGLVESEQVPGQERHTIYAITEEGRSIHHRISRLGPAERTEWWRSVADDDLRARERLPGLDTSVPNVARMYDFWLGGKDHFAADRMAATAVMEAFPDSRDNCRHNRAFLQRVVRYLAASGIRQFLDIGTGLPTMENTHEVAQAVQPGARVAYVDNDPAVVRHAQALVATSPGVTATWGDLRDPSAIIGHPDVRRLIDFAEPVAVLLVAVLHFIGEDERPGDLVETLSGTMAPGSALVITHISDHAPREDRQAAQKAYERASAPLTPRSRARIMSFFDGLQLVPPGLVDVRQWRPLPESAEDPGELRSTIYGGVGLRQANGD